MPRTAAGKPSSDWEDLAGGAPPVQEVPATRIPEINATRLVRSNFLIAVMALSLYTMVVHMRCAPLNATSIT
jgi:hypothetical protein